MEKFSARATRFEGLAAAAPDLLSSLIRFDRIETTALVAGLLLAPECRPAVPRIEALVHAAVIGCAGPRTPTRDNVAGWFNRHIDRAKLRRIEDPAEDLFVMHVWCDAGNFRFLGGIWETADHMVQTVLDLIATFPDREEFKFIDAGVMALIRLADDAVRRCELGELETGAPGYAVQVPLPDADTMAACASFLRFSAEDLKSLGIDATTLRPFILPTEGFAQLAHQDMRASSLNRFPLLETDDGYLLALPTAVCVAIREFFVEAICQLGFAGSLGDLLRLRQLDVLGYDCLSPMGGTQVLPKDRPPLDLHLPVDDYITRFDLGAYCIAWFIRDERLRAGKAAESNRALQELEPEISQSLIRLVQFVSGLPDFRRGLVLLVYGGFSGGLRMKLPSLPKGWYLQSYSLPNLEIVARSSGANLRRLWRQSRAEDRLRQRGVTIANMNGDFNLYAWWWTNAKRLLPAEASWQGKLMFQIPLNGLLQLRVDDRNRYRRHAAFRPNIEPAIIVRRDSPHAIFSIDRDRPLFREARGAQRRRLWAIVETAQRGWWVIANQWSEQQNARSVILQIWNCACEWMSRLAPLLEPDFAVIKGPVEFQLKFAAVETWHDGKAAPMKVEAVKPPAVAVDVASRTVVLTVDKEFFEGFRQEANRAERVLVRTMVEASFGLLQRACPAERWAGIEGKLLPNDDVRFFHSHLTHDTEFMGLAVNAPKQPMLPEEVVIDASAGATDPVQIIRVVTDREEAKKIVFAAVDRLKKLTVAELAVLDRESVVARCFRSMESVRAEHHQWRVAAAAMRVLHDPAELAQVATEHESRRSEQAMASRALVEATMFGCPASGGREIAEIEFEDLLARQIVLMHLGIFAEELKSPLEVDPVRILPSGEIECGGILGDRILREFTQAVFRDKFDAAADSYSELFAPKAGKRPNALWAAINGGLIQEYGLNVHDIADCIGFLAKEAEDSGRSFWVMKENEIVAFLTKKLEVPEPGVRQFVRRIQLYPWSLTDGEAPAGFKPRDTAPWHFRRRFSLLARPLIALENADDARVMVCPAQLSQSFDYLVRQTAAGSFNHEFFDTEAMRNVVRERAKVRSTAFEAKVGEAFRGAGYNVILNLEMRTVGAPKQLGEIDVLAWDASGKLWIVECKLLRAVYSAADAVHQLAEFGGNPGDDLGKHLGRVSWLSGNLPALARATGCAPYGDPQALLVTSNLVPLHFLTDDRFKDTALVNYATLGAKILGTVTKEDE